MRLQLWIFLGLLAWCATGASADQLRQCAGVELAWECNASTPILLAKRTQRHDDLRYFFTFDGAATSLVLGDKQRQVSLPSDGKRVLISGLSRAGTNGCCFSERLIPPPPIGLCSQDQAAPEQPTNMSENPGTFTPTPPVLPAFDRAVSIASQTKCSEGSNGEICEFEVGISRPKGVPENTAVPLNVTAEVDGDVQFDLSMPLGCFKAGSIAILCQIPDQLIPTTKVSFPGKLKISPAYVPREIRVCAAFGAALSDNGLLWLIQEALTSLGYDPGKVDGLNGPETQAAALEFARAMGLRDANPLSPAFLETLGLGAYSDDTVSNNLACSTSLIPARKRPACNRATSWFDTGSGRCVCRYSNMVRNRDELSCSCRAGWKFTAGRGCFKPVVDTLMCDRATTIQSGEKCLCRHPSMLRISETKCGCPAGVSYSIAHGCG